jgi:hypothetical protein
MIDKLKTLIGNIKNRVTSIESVNDVQNSDISALQAIPSIINIVFNSSVNSKQIVVTLDKPRVGSNPLLIKDINTGNTQANSQSWAGNVCTITTTDDVVVPFLIIVQ